jgi:hypothetical protein
MNENILTNFNISSTNARQINEEIVRMAEKGWKLRAAVPVIESPARGDFTAAVFTCPTTDSSKMATPAMLNAIQKVIDSDPLFLHGLKQTHAFAAKHLPDAKVEEVRAADVQAQCLENIKKLDALKSKTR